MAKRILLLAISYQLLASSFLSAQTGTWTALNNLPPHPNYGVCLLMTDGTVICKCNSGPGYGTGWDRLTSDSTGSYINGTWDTIAPMNYDRIAFSAQVLPSGKVYVAGGEYGPGGGYGEVYDPATNTWTMCGNIPTGWNIYDGNSELLYDGTVLEGPQIGLQPSFNNLIWSPLTNQYTSAPNSLCNHDEAQWLKLPDSSVLFVGIASQLSNRYIPQKGIWVNDSSTPGMLYDRFGEESGCGLMLPNGKAIFFGATPYNCIYTPSGNMNPGSWASADSFPQINGTYVGQPDAPGAMMVNGHILLAVSPLGNSPNTEINSPTYFLEYDYTTNTFTQVKATIPGQGGDSISYMAAYQGQMLDLPDGNVLLSISQTNSLTNQYYIYTPGSAPIPQGKPTIDHVVSLTCTSYMITGKLFNGISEGAAYGDDWQMATNYPLVRLTDGTHVYYTKTTNWNRAGAVQTDSLEDTAYFAVPPIPIGTYSAVVAVNGFASNPVVMYVDALGMSLTTKNVTCYGETDGTAKATPINGASPYTYKWSPAGQTTASISGLSAGTYNVTITSGGCSTSSIVTISQPAALFITPDSQPDDGTGDGIADLIMTGGTLPYTYLWNPGGATSDSISGRAAGTYCCKVTDANGCTNSACVTIQSDAGVNQVKVESGKVKVYPNPGNGIFQLQLSGVSGQWVEVYNILGEKVYSQFIAHSSSFIVDVSRHPNGIYFYRVITADGSLVGEGKLVIEK